MVWSHVLSTGGDALRVATNDCKQQSSIFQPWNQTEGYKRKSCKTKIKIKIIQKESTLLTEDFKNGNYEI